MTPLITKRGSENPIIGALYFIVALIIIGFTFYGILYQVNKGDTLSFKIENAEPCKKLNYKMDVLNLKKNDVINLEKGLDYVIVGLGWTEKDNIDVDVSAICLDASGTCSSPAANLLFYGSNKVNSMPTILNGALVHTGDDRTGGGGIDEPNEEIKVQLNKIPNDVAEIVFFATIDKSREKLFTFADAPNSFIVVSDGMTEETKAMYRLKENFRSAESVVAGSLKRTGNVWSFKAVGEGKRSNLQEIISEFCAGNVSFEN